MPSRPRGAGQRRDRVARRRELAAVRHPARQVNLLLRLERLDQPLAVERQVKLPGEFEPYLAVPIYAKLAGFVKRVAVDRGSTVKQGQVLVTLEAPEMQAQIIEAQSKAQALGRAASRNSDRWSAWQPGLGAFSFA